MHFFVMIEWGVALAKTQLSLAGEQSVGGSVELVTAVEELELEDEEEAQQLATELLDHLTGSEGRATWNSYRQRITIHVFMYC